MSYHKQAMFPRNYKYTGMAKKDSAVKNMRHLSELIEIISDEFGSTFTVVDKDSLSNCLGLRDDFQSVLGIIKKHMPYAQICFHKASEDIGAVEGYAVYIIRDHRFDGQQCARAI